MAVPCSCFSIVVTAVFVGPTGVRKYEAGHQQEREYHEFFHGVLTKTLPRSAWVQSIRHPSTWLFKSSANEFDTSMRICISPKRVNVVGLHANHARIINASFSANSPVWGISKRKHLQ